MEKSHDCICMTAWYGKLFVVLSVGSETQVGLMLSGLVCQHPRSNRSGTIWTVTGPGKRGISLVPWYLSSVAFTSQQVRYSSQYLTSKVWHFRHSALCAAELWPSHSASPSGLAQYWLAWTNHPQVPRKHFRLEESRALVLQSSDWGLMS